MPFPSPQLPIKRLRYFGSLSCLGFLLKRHFLLYLEIPFFSFRVNLCIAAFEHVYGLASKMFFMTKSPCSKLVRFQVIYIFVHEKVFISMLQHSSKTCWNLLDWNKEGLLQNVSRIRYSFP